jgi:hypothetical protein
MDFHLRVSVQPTIGTSAIVKNRQCNKDKKS